MHGFDHCKLRTSATSCAPLEHTHSARQAWLVMQRAQAHGGHKPSHLSLSLTRMCLLAYAAPDLHLLALGSSTSHAQRTHCRRDC